VRVCVYFTHVEHQMQDTYFYEFITMLDLEMKCLDSRYGSQR